MPGILALACAFLPLVISATNPRPLLADVRGGQTVSAKVRRRLHPDGASGSMTAVPFDSDAAEIPSASEVDLLYVGCFEHDWNTNGLQYVSHDEDATPEACAAQCRVMSQDGEAPSFVAVEFGFVCFCGWGDEDEYSGVEASSCTLPCRGDESAMCGGYSQYDLYRLTLEAADADPVSSEVAVEIPTEGATGDEPSDPDMAEILLEHNIARCMHATDPLTYSLEVEAKAQAWADTLATDLCGEGVHDDDPDYGGNIFVCYTNSETDCFEPGFAMENLYEQELNGDDPSEWGYHSTQILWDTTEKLGCARSRCSTNGWNYSYMVCKYTPPGNYVGQFAEHVKPLTTPREECLDQTSLTPSESPTPAPTSELEPEVTPAPTAEPEPEATPAPTPEPEPEATPAPTAEPEPEATPAPTPEVAPEPMPEPTPAPVSDPGDGTCSSNPCQNGGSCATDPSGGYWCTCPSGFGGMKCQTNTAGLASWSIILEYEGSDFTASRRAVFESAATRWAEIIKYVPGGGSPTVKAGTLTIKASLKYIDGSSGTLGQAGPEGRWDEHPGISYSGIMEFDSADIEDMELNGTFEGVILHEMGHVIGIGSLWGSCSRCEESNDATWYCDSAREAYNQLAGQPADAAAPLIELEYGQGTKCGHFTEETFDDELMTGFVNNGGMALSKLTCASLEDQGYVVSPDNADEYLLPSKRGSLVRTTPEEKFALNDEMIDHTMTVMSESGETYEIQGTHFRF